MIAYRDVCMYVHINIYVYISVKDDCNAYCCLVMSAAVSGGRVYRRCTCSPRRCRGHTADIHYTP